MSNLVLRISPRPPRSVVRDDLCDLVGLLWTPETNFKSAALDTGRLRDPSFLFQQPQPGGIALHPLRHLFQRQVVLASLRLPVGDVARLLDIEKFPLLTCSSFPDHSHPKIRM